MILTTAKLELKRVASWKEKNIPDEAEIAVSVDDYDSEYDDSSTNSPNGVHGVS